VVGGLGRVLLVALGAVFIALTWGIGPCSRAFAKVLPKAKGRSQTSDFGLQKLA
jgi:hypothetical protein